MKRSNSPLDVDSSPAGGAMNRRGFLAAGLVLTAAGLAGCQSAGLVGLPDQADLPDEQFDYAAAYAAWPDGDYTWPAINYKNFDQKYWRQIVEYKTRERPGTIIVDPYNNFLYWTLGNGVAYFLASPIANSLIGALGPRGYTSFAMLSGICAYNL